MKIDTRATQMEQKGIVRTAARIVYTPLRVVYTTRGSSRN